MLVSLVYSVWRLAVTFSCDARSLEIIARLKDEGTLKNEEWRNIIKWWREERCQRWNKGQARDADNPFKNNRRIDANKEQNRKRAAVGPFPLNRKRTNTSPYISPARTSTVGTAPSCQVISSNMPAKWVVHRYKEKHILDGSSSFRNNKKRNNIKEGSGRLRRRQLRQSRHDVPWVMFPFFGDQHDASNWSKPNWFLWLFFPSARQGNIKKKRGVCQLWHWRRPVKTNHDAIL